MDHEERKDLFGVGTILVVTLIILSAHFGWFGLSTAGSAFPCAPGASAGFQGENDGICAYQVGANQPTLLNNAFPTSAYSWQGFATPSSISVQATRGGLFSTGTFFQNCQTNPVSSQSLFSTPQQVKYYVASPTNSSQRMLVQGQVNQYTFTCTLQLQSGGQYSFSGDTVWNVLYTSTWNQLVAGPNGATGNAFETPLYAVVTNAQWQNQNANQVNLGTVGTALTFYSQPNAGQGGSSLTSQLNWTPSTTNLNASLSGTFAPDSRMSQTEYYPVALQAFGPSCFTIASCSYPQLTFTVTLYTLQIGEFILTNPSTVGQGGFTGSTCSGFACVTQAIQNFLSDPWNRLLTLLGVGAIGTVAVIVIVLVFGGSAVLALVTLYLSRRKEEE